MQDKKSITDPSYEENPIVAQFKEDVVSPPPVEERSTQTYRDFTSNTSALGKLHMQILIGIREGEDIYQLFMMAVEAISAMTNSKTFYEQVKNELAAVYGEGLLIKQPLQQELEETAERLEKLKESVKRDMPDDTRQRLVAAIKNHEDKIEKLRSEIQ